MRQKTVIKNLLQSVTEVYYKIRQILESVTEVYYKVHQVSQSVSGNTNCDRILSQSASGITKRDMQFIQSVTLITKWGVTAFVPDARFSIIFTEIRLIGTWDELKTRNVASYPN